MNWYYSDRDKAIGPIAEATMMELRACGTLSGDSQVCQEGTETWLLYDETFRTKQLPQTSEIADTETVLIRFHCPQCNVRISADREDEGQSANCPSCGAGLVVHENDNLAESSTPSKIYDDTHVTPPVPATVTIEDIAAAPPSMPSPSLSMAARNLIDSLARIFQILFGSLKSAATSDSARATMQRMHTGSAHIRERVKEMAKSAANSEAAQTTVHRVSKSASEIHERVTNLAKTVTDSETKRNLPENNHLEPNPESNIKTRSVHDDAGGFSIARLIPLFVCCLLFGWVAGAWLMPDRAFISASLIGQIIPVIMLAVPALILAVMGICLFVRPSRFPLQPAILALLFTMLIGLASLLAFQTIAANSLDAKIKYHGKLTILLYIAQFIGWSYQAIDSSNLILRFVGFVCGVGFCEEITKIFPLLWYVVVSKKQQIDFRGFLIVGFFSGLGFGIGEAILGYSPWAGRPLVGVNVLRWFACVPSHAIYTVIDAAFLWILIPRIKAAESKSEAAFLCSLAAIVVAIVHGTYNTLSSFGVLLALMLDTSAIFLMYFVIVWVAKKTGEKEMTSENKRIVSKGVIGWLRNEQAGNMRFGRIYMVSSAMIVCSLVFSSSMAQIQGMQDEGVYHDYQSEESQSEESLSRRENYLIYYSLGTQLNPGLNRYNLESLVRSVMQEHPEIDRSQYDLIVTALEDGYLGNPKKY